MRIKTKIYILPLFCLPVAPGELMKQVGGECDPRGAAAGSDGGTGCAAGNAVPARD